jgi:hypothetical protein
MKKNIFEDEKDEEQNKTINEPSTNTFSDEKEEK